MTSGEFSGSGIPQDEHAPNFATLWEHKGVEPTHYSTLTPDPEAKVDMRIWAKLFAQIKAFDQWGEIYAYGQLPDQDISIDLPAEGTFNDQGPCTSVYCSFDKFATDDTRIIGRTSFTLELDLTRPGYIEIYEGVVIQPEHLKPHELLADSELIEPPNEGLYMAQEGGSVGYRFAKRVLSQETAELISELLAAANLADEDTLNHRFESGLALMEPDVREAVHRHYVLRKKLDRSPEEAFKPSEWSWDNLPSQSGRHPNTGIYADHWNKLETFAPPGGYPCDGVIIFDFLDSIDKDKGEWIKAIWDKEQLPDNFYPMFTDPTSLETVSPAELIAAVPEEMKGEIAKWAQDSLFWRRNWVDMTIQSIDSVIDMTEEEFAERKKKHDEEDEHFYWGLHRSLRSCIDTALHSADRPYTEWTAQYDQIAQGYADFYGAYAEAIQQFPHEERPMGPSLWKSDEEREELYRKVLRAYQKMAELPEDPPESEDDLGDTEFKFLSED